MRESPTACSVVGIDRASGSFMHYGDTAEPKRDLSFGRVPAPIDTDVADHRIDDAPSSSLTSIHFPIKLPGPCQLVLLSSFEQNFARSGYNEGSPARAVACFGHLARGRRVNLSVSDRSRLGLICYSWRDPSGQASDDHMANFSLRATTRRLHSALCPM
jgi:hypothetical protein